MDEDDEKRVQEQIDLWGPLVIFVWEAVALLFFCVWTCR